eukprot:9765455-Ditylum_brightwellii.AAC.1
MTNWSKRGGSSLSEGTNLTLVLSTEGTITATEVRELLEGIRALRDLGIRVATSNNADASNSATTQDSSSNTQRASSSKIGATSATSAPVCWLSAPPICPTNSTRPM